MKSAFLFFDTNFTAKLVKKKVKDGKVVIENGEYEVDKTAPFQLKSFFGSCPLYLMKWNSLYPMTFETKEEVSSDAQVIKSIFDGKHIQMARKELVPVKPEFYEKGGIGYSPQALKTTADVRFLKGMKKYGEGGMDWKSIMTWVLGIMIFVAGAFLVYMFATGQIKL
jgi:hypothetical protein